MIVIYTYFKKSKKFNRELSGNIDICINTVKSSEDFTLTPPPDYTHEWRWVDNKWITETN